MKIYKNMSYSILFLRNWKAYKIVLYTILVYLNDYFSYHRMDFCEIWQKMSTLESKKAQKNWNFLIWDMSVLRLSKCKCVMCKCFKHASGDFWAYRRKKIVNHFFTRNYWFSPPFYVYFHYVKVPKIKKSQKYSNH